MRTLLAILFCIVFVAPRLAQDNASHTDEAAIRELVSKYNCSTRKKLSVPIFLAPI